MTEPSAAIRVEHLHRRFVTARKVEGLWASLKNLISPVYDEIKAVNDLELNIMPGELVGFLGPNGAGKTTTLKILSGLIPPTEGMVQILGVDPFQRDYDFLKSISLVMGQKQNLWWDLPPAETLALHRELYDIPPEEYRHRRDELVEMLEIGDCLDIQARKLSLGQRMRCELAVALLHRPRVLFLDEPTIGLDILMQKKIREFLLTYHARFQPTILLTSHYMEDVEALTKRIVVINRGRKVYDGALNRLTAEARLEKILTVTFTQPCPESVLQAWGSLIHVEGTRYRLRVTREKAASAAAGLYARGDVADLSLEEAPLEEALAGLFGQHPIPGDHP